MKSTLLSVSRWRKSSPELSGEFMGKSWDVGMMQTIPPRGLGAALNIFENWHFETPEMAYF